MFSGTRDSKRAFSKISLWMGDVVRSSRMDICVRVLPSWDNTSYKYVGLCEVDGTADSCGIDGLVLLGVAACKVSLPRQGII